ncbi:MAG: calcineurin-like phosphoesterase family protein [Pseudomonadota bacterium]
MVSGKQLLEALVVALVAGLPVMALAATGVVYEDSNGNGTLDAGEPGIADVRVSDGNKIVETDADGRWRLDIGAQAVIFITKPAGYQVAVNAQQIPQFYYIHQPAGSPPQLRFPGVEPTGPLPDSINFGLRRQEEPAVFEALLFADTQPQTEVELDYIRDKIITELLGTTAQFGMTLGDIMFDDLALFPRYLDIIAQLGIPWYNVPGNHELNMFAENDEDSLETFKRYFGPPYYSFEFGGAHFVVLDNIEYQGHGESDPGDVRGSGGYIANFGARQLAWLKRELAFVPKDKLVFLAMHSPLETYAGTSKGSTTQDRKALFRLLSGRENLYAVAGHTHTTEHHYFDEDDGFRGPEPFHHHVLSTVSGSWWSGPFDENGLPTTWQRDGTPNGYHILEVDGVDAKVRFKAAGKPADFQMRIMYDVHYHGLRKDGLRDFRHGELFDGRMGIDHVPAAQVLVNLFDGGPKSRVFFRVGSGAEIEMQRVVRRDPMIMEMWARDGDEKKSWVEATPSSHIWSADLPDDLVAGVHTLSVRAVDEFGRTHHGHSILEITTR